jgi:hypothetical protein
MADSGEEKGWFVLRKETLYGPFSEEKMRVFARDGRLSPRSLVTPTRSEEARPIREIPVLCSLLQAAFQEAKKKNSEPTSAPEMVIKPSVARASRSGRRSTERRGRPALMMTLLLLPLLLLLVVVYQVLGRPGAAKQQVVQSLEESSPLRRELNRGPLPQVMPLFLSGVTKGLNFSRQELMALFQDQVVIRQEPEGFPPMPAPYDSHPSRALLLVDRDGYYVRYHFDGDEVCVAVTVWHQGFSRVKRSDHLPSDLPRTAKVVDKDQGEEWRMTLFDGFFGSLLWRFDGGELVLEQLLVSQE